MGVAFKDGQILELSGSGPEFIFCMERIENDGPIDQIDMRLIEYVRVDILPPGLKSDVRAIARRSHDERTEKKSG